MQVIFFGAMGAWFVDFDDALNGPAIQDVWMLLNGSPQEQRNQLETLLEEYSEFSSLNTKEFALIEPLRALRMVKQLAWIVSRWEDSAFPKAFPWITTNDFWQNQTAQFNEQIHLLNEPPIQLTPMY